MAPLVMTCRWASAGTRPWPQPAKRDGCEQTRKTSQSPIATSLRKATETGIYPRDLARDISIRPAGMAKTASARSASAMIPSRASFLRASRGETAQRSARLSPQRRQDRASPWSHRLHREKFQTSARSSPCSYLLVVSSYDKTRARSVSLKKTSHCPERDAPPAALQRPHHCHSIFSAG
jgi:hypothetical protein